MNGREPPPYTAPEQGKRDSTCLDDTGWSSMTRKGSQVRVLYGPLGNPRSEVVLAWGPSRLRANSGLLVLGRRAENATTMPGRDLNCVGAVPNQRPTSLWLQ